MHLFSAAALVLAFAGPPDVSLDGTKPTIVVPPSVLVEGDPFRQLEEVLPTPNDFRTASGAPGPRYWQQRADHAIAVRLDPVRAEISGTQRVRYRNDSPDELRYLWLQLDQNRFRSDSLGDRARPAPDLSKPIGIRDLRNLVEQQQWSGGYRDVVATSGGARLATTFVDTMMRIDLPAPLAPGATFEFETSWTFPVVKNTYARTRSNYELLGEGDPELAEPDLAPLYAIAQFFPRLAPYTDVRGWQHNPFIGQGEFALEFGDYELAITVPDTWIVAATGELANPEEVLTPAQRERLAAAAADPKPRFIVTPDEAEANRAAAPKGEKTWRFVAKDVRDVAFGASPAFLWDAAQAPIPGTERSALAMSFYPKEAEPLWSRYSTHAVAHTIDVYSRFAVPYPYPVAISVNAAIGGMEYPMLSFNGPRAEKDGTYTAGAKWGLVGVVIHEVGHNWFPMIVNSDERQWTWMDEGLNTFLQYLAEQEWEDRYPSGRGEPEKIVGYMTSPEQEPIMTNSESVRRLGPNAYAKPATALNVLRETVLGRENFDFAFREYCRRWAFRRPEPADFFRSMEDASGVDLDWFWRGWFYSTRPVDVSIDRVVRYRLETRGPDLVKGEKRAERDARPPTLGESRNEPLPKRADRFPELLDVYSAFDEFDVTDGDRRAFADLVARLGERDAALLDEPLFFTIARFANHGGVPTPLPLVLTFADGSVEERSVPAEIWRYAGGNETSKLFVTAKEVVRVEFDPRRETADRDPSDNAFPQDVERAWFAVAPTERGENRMRTARDEARRTRTRAAAGTLAARVAEAVRAGRSAGSVMAAGDAAPDGWDRAFVVLDGAPVGSGGIAEIVSGGPDGAVGGDDDVGFFVTSDGQLKDRPRVRRGPGAR